ncbi:MAG: hypothetical protein HRU15_03240, partial [Planctomycetes bacterium]|nr:hypothetical protein [Planctomycetota bacterium]
MKTGMISLLLVLIMLCSMYAAETDGSSNPTSEVHYSIINTKQQPQSDAYTATIGSIPGTMDRIWGNGSFEPVIYRTKFKTSAAAENEIIIPGSIQDVYRKHSGFWDDANIQVLRIINNKMVLVRQAKVESYINDAWFDSPITRGSRVLKPETTEVTMTLNKRSLRPGIYWYGIRCINKKAQLSDNITWAKVDMKQLPDQGPKTRIKTTKIKGNFRLSDKLKAPNKLIADYENGTLKLSWPAVSDIAGYNVYISHIDPAKHNGQHIMLSPKASKKSEHIQKGDMVFIAQKKPDLDCEQDDLPWIVERLKWILGSNKNDTQGISWQHIKHDATSSAVVTDGGESYLQAEISGGSTFTLKKYSHGDTTQS